MHPLIVLGLGMALGWIAAGLRAAPRAKRKDYQLAVLRGKLRQAGFGLPRMR